MVILHTKAVFFDLFETLVTEFTDGKRTINRSTNDSTLFGMNHEDFKKEWGNRQEARMTGQFVNFIEVMRNILEKRNLPYNEQIVEHLYRTRIEEKKAPFLTIQPAVIAMLEQLQSKHIKIGLISNCTEEEVQQWQASELAPYFDDAIFSFKVGLAKPDIRIYQLACERMGVDPGNAVFVGDGGSSELDGAYNAGLHPYHAFWFNTYITSRFKKLLHPEHLINQLP
ncbi:HAD family hydrolase [Bacillus sp. FJAT-28004]|uniref:HAD family hydrolase n=1 Tax=Bacillus sp. FJAT-28004 TaxID=1679165 RepID=UPI000A5C92A0|nr:HAD family hydrolase [Bacillus sp. FJAT-28004]